MTGRSPFKGGLAVVVMLSLAQATLAEPAPFQPDFTARRVAVPQGKGPRITVQIDPEAQAARLAALPKPSGRPKTPVPADRPAPVADVDPGQGAGVTGLASNYAWYWDLVPPRPQGAGLPGAVAALSQGPGGASVRAPRLQHLQEIAASYGKDILAATLGTEVSPALVIAMIGVESAGRPDAVSHAGATGLMQLIPATATRFGVADAKDPVQNIRGGVAYLDWLMREFDRDPLMVVAAYNAGEGAVKANGGVPPYAETRDYVPKVLAAWQVAQGLCVSAPELISDPCVFKVIASG